MDLNTVNLNCLFTEPIIIAPKKRQDLKNLTKYLSPRRKAYYHSIIEGQYWSVLQN